MRRISEVVLIEWKFHATSDVIDYQYDESEQCIMMNVTNDRVNMRKIFLITIVIFAATCGNLSAQKVESKAADGIIKQHDYKTGEIFTYFFEDTETVFSTKDDKGFPRAQEPIQIEQLQFYAKVSIIENNGMKLKKYELSDAKYRKLPKDVLLSGKSGSVEFQTVIELIPEFPKVFSYTCSLNESDVLKSILQPCTPYMDKPIGAFFYRELTDLHTIPSQMIMIGSETVGCASVGESWDIPLAGGSFHNHKPVRLFHSINVMNGIRQAYFKVITMGNFYDTPTMKTHTNYQSSFNIAIEGPISGILTYGEIQEHGYPIGVPAMICRQISMRLVDNAKE